MAGPRVLVTRGGSAGTSLCAAIIEAGGPPVPYPLISIVPGPDRLGDVPEDAVVALTSAAGVDAVRGCGRPVAVVGEATRDAAVAAGLDVRIVADGTGASALADALEGARVARVVWPCGDRALPTLFDRMTAAGVPISRKVVYRTVLGPPEDSPPADVVLADLSAAIFASPSAVEALLACSASESVSGRLRSETRAVAIGRTTQGALQEAGFGQVIVASGPSNAALVAAALGR